MSRGTPILTHRKACADDLNLLVEWNEQLIQDENHRNNMSRAELRDRMVNWIEHEYRATIFEHDGEPVAYSLHREEETQIYLRQFYVDRQQRRKGIGRAAMKILFAEIWPEDRTLAVEVLAHNAAAYSFWSAVGYQPWSIRMERPPGA